MVSGLVGGFHLLDWAAHWVWVERATRLGEQAGSALVKPGSVVSALVVMASALGPGVTGKFLNAGVNYDVQLRAMGAYALICACLMTVLSKKLLARDSSVL